MSYKEFIQCLLISLFSVTVINFGFDWAFREIGKETWLWQGGAIAALTTVWIVGKYSN